MDHSKVPFLATKVWFQGSDSFSEMWGEKIKKLLRLDENFPPHQLSPGIDISEVSLLFVLNLKSM